MDYEKLEKSAKAKGIVPADPLGGHGSVSFLLDDPDLRKKLQLLQQ